MIVVMLNDDNRWDEAVQFLIMALNYGGGN